MLKLTTVSLLLTSVASPLMAQTPAPPAKNQSTAVLDTPATPDIAGKITDRGNETPSGRNTVVTDAGGMRSSKIVGSSVYDDQDQKIGSVDDLVIGNDKSLSAVISVGGFLGIGSKMVEVPFDKLHFGNSSNDNHVVVPGMTRDALNAMPDYHYPDRG
jgi:hypothetical protein